MEYNVHCVGCGHNIRFMFKINFCNQCLAELASAPWVIDASMSATARREYATIPFSKRYERATDLRPFFNFKTEAFF